MDEPIVARQPPLWHTEPSPVSEAPEQETYVDKPNPARRWRLVALGVFVVASIVVAKLTGLTEYLDIERVRSFMESTGPLGFLAFVALFAIGQLLHVPGMVFVGAASIAYGEIVGIGAAYAGSITSVMLSFVIVRTIGGQPLATVRRPLLRKIFARLESHPILTIVILRVLFSLAPWLNYGLAMSTVRARDFAIGSALGLIPPIVLGVLFFDWLAGILM
jgi:uncharacterized membrane protein YdjX (TVP38/TMEM64 family)